MKTVVKMKIKINGKEYDSVDVMPEDVRDIYERALAKIENERGDLGKIVQDGLKSDGLKTFRSSKYSFSLGPREVSLQFSGGLKGVYQRIWFYLVTGVFSFFGGIALIQYLADGKNIFASPYIWLMAVPAFLLFMAAYTSIRSWRCPSCRAFLPTRFIDLQSKKCPTCGRELDL